MDAVWDGGVVFDDLAAIADNSDCHLEALGYSGEVVAQDEVLVIRQASQCLSHPLLGDLLDDADVAEAVALALFCDPGPLQSALLGYGSPRTGRAPASG